MRFDSEREQGYAIFAAETTKSGGVESMMRQPENPEVHEEEEDSASTEPETEKTQHA